MSTRPNATLNGEALLHPAVRGLSTSRERELRIALRRKVAAPDQIWGHYNNYRANGVVVSILVHCALLALLLSGIFMSHQITSTEIGALNPFSHASACRFPFQCLVHPKMQVFASVFCALRSYRVSSKSLQL
jgi:hypothetical protein